MSTRSTRRPQAQPLLTPLESLLLAQAAWQLGAGSNSWPDIAKILFKHPLLSRPKSFFTAQSCHAMYQQLMKDAELDLNDLNDNPHAPLNLKLAEKHYRTRHSELRDLILAEESKFKTTLKEIEDIRAGLWDKKIRATLSGEPETSSELAPEENERNLDSAEPVPQILEGSQVSGVTESVDSLSMPSQEKDEIPSLTAAAHKDLQKIDTPAKNISEPRSLTDLSSPPIEVDLAATPTEIITQKGTVAIITDEEKQGSRLPETAQVENTETPVSPETTVPTSEVAHGMGDLQQSNAVEMECQKSETHLPSSEEAVAEFEETYNEKQEEEEEDNIQRDGSIAEEDEASQDAPEDVEMEIVHSDEGHRNLSEPSEEVKGADISDHAITPATAAALSEADLAEDRSSTSEEEPVVPTRRSTRQRKSSITSAPLPTTRKRLRSQARLSETEPQVAMDSENDDEEDIKDENTPQPEDERSSPFDGAMTRRRDGKRKASFMDSVDSPSDKKRMRDDSEPVDEDEPGPSSHNTRARITRHGTRTEEQVALKRFQNVIGMLHSQISQHRNGNIFHNPIKNSEAPDYHEIVKRPMDLKTIKTRFRDGLIANSLEYQRDIFLMFANSMMYNRPGSDVYTMAEDMMLESEGQITSFRQTEGLVKRGQRQT